MRRVLQTGNLLLASLLFAGTSQANVSGRVLNLITHEPLANADVTLTCVEPEYRKARCTISITTTSRDGAFSFDAVTPARYLLSANAPGMAQTRDSSIEVVISYRRHLYDASEDLQLAPESKISGKVVDFEHRPRSGIEVIAWRQFASGPFTRLRAVSKTLSGDSGEYVLSKLAPGNYYVATLLRKPGAPPKKNQDVKGVLIYAPSAFTLSEATVVHLDTGEATKDIELRLRPFLTYHLEGRAQMEPLGEAISGTPSLYLDPRGPNGLTAPGRELDLDPSGKFEADVLPGVYTLRLVGTTIPNPTRGSQPQPMRLHLLAKQDIEISGKDTYGIGVLISPRFTIDGQLSVENQPNEPIQSGEVTLEAVDPIAPAGSLAEKIQADGSFSISNADPVSYAIRYAPPAGMYVKSIELNGQDALFHYLEFSTSAGGRMKIVLQPGAGCVNVSLGSNSTASNVILIPDLWIDSKLTPVVHLSSRGTAFSASGLTPGGYTAVATARLDPQTWANNAFVQEMKTRGTAFLLHESEQKAVNAAEVGRDEIRRIELLLGLY